jgi:hypothetical protein
MYVCMYVCASSGSECGAMRSATIWLVRNSNTPSDATTKYLSSALISLRHTYIHSCRRGHTYIHTVVCSEPTSRGSRAPRRLRSLPRCCLPETGRRPCQGNPRSWTTPAWVEISYIHTYIHAHTHSYMMTRVGYPRRIAALIDIFPYR